MAHIVLDLSLPSFFFYIAIFKFLLRAYRAPRVTRVHRDDTRALPSAILSDPLRRSPLRSACDHRPESASRFAIMKGSVI